MKQDVLVPFILILVDDVSVASCFSSPATSSSSYRIGPIRKAAFVVDDVVRNDRRPGCPCLRFHIHESYSSCGSGISMHDYGPLLSLPVPVGRSIGLDDNDRYTTDHPPKYNNRPSSCQFLHQGCVSSNLLLDS